MGAGKHTYMFSIDCSTHVTLTERHSIDPCIVLQTKCCRQQKAHQLFMKWWRFEIYNISIECLQSMATNVPSIQSACMHS